MSSQDSNSPRGPWSPGPWTPDLPYVGVPPSPGPQVLVDLGSQVPVDLESPNPGPSGSGGAGADGPVVPPQAAVSGPICPIFPWVPDWSPQWQRSALKLNPLRHCTEWELFKSNDTVHSDEERQAVFDAYVVRMLMSVRSPDVLSRKGRPGGPYLVALGWVYRAVHPNRITCCHDFMIASKHLETWVFMQPDGQSVDLNVDSWEPESTWVQGRITPGDRTNVSLLVNFMSKEISRLPSGRTRSNLNCGDRRMVTFSLPPDFPRQHQVPLEVEERVSKFFEECLQVVKGDFHESVMLLKALSALRDESQDFARQYTLVEDRMILAESALRMSFRDILAWKIWMGPVRMSVSSPSTYRVNY